MEGEEENREEKKNLYKDGTRTGQKEGQEQDIYNQKENENRWMIRQERG